jgi:hypothetical protein
MVTRCCHEPPGCHRTMDLRSSTYARVCLSKFGIARIAIRMSSLLQSTTAHRSRSDTAASNLLLLEDAPERLVVPTDFHPS